MDVAIDQLREGVLVLFRAYWRSRSPSLAWMSMVVIGSSMGIHAPDGKTEQEFCALRGSSNRRRCNGSRGGRGGVGSWLALRYTSRMAIQRYRFFKSNQAAQLRRLVLTVGGVVEGVFAGLHKSPHKGFSIEFAEHREYVPGDELKHLDWTVLARSDRYYIKQYEQETNLRADICLDASGSMDYRGADAVAAIRRKGAKAEKIKNQKSKIENTQEPGKVSKFEYAAVLAASLAFMLANQQDLVGLTVFDEKITLEIPQGNGPSHLDQIFKKLEEVRPGRETNVAAALHELANKIPRRGLVILISDLLDDPDHLLLALQHLRHARHQLVVLQVLDRSETELPFARPVTFEDMENQSRLQIDPQLIRQEYRRQMRAFLDDLKLRCGQFRMDYVLAYTDVPWEAQIREVLRRTSGK